MKYILDEKGAILWSYSNDHENPDPRAIDLPVPPFPNLCWDGTEWIEDDYLLAANLCNQVDETLKTKLESGFDFQGITFQADAMAQTNATAFLTALTAGLPVLPINWRTSDNQMVQFQTAQDFGEFATTLMGYVQSVYSSIWTTKDLIRTATNKEEATRAFEIYSRQISI